MLLNMTVNGRAARLKIEENERLLDVLRLRLYLTGTKEGCGVGECGACTVIVDGDAVNACLVFAAGMEGKSVTTVEGLEKNGELHPLQQAILEHNALQCGFCTPGFLMSAKALLDKNSNPSREEISRALSGNLCRCTGYAQIIDSVEDAVKRILSLKDKIAGEN